jgi:glycosyltransferase involved in cell wall biosynthesis
VYKKALTLDRASDDILSDEMVTVVLPVLNPQIDWFKEALESIKAQTYTHWNIIIVNDGCDTTYREALHKLVNDDPLLFSKTKIIDLAENKGVAEATNIGLRACASRLVALLGADDRMRPQRLARQTAKFRRCPELSIVGGTAQLIDDNGLPLQGANNKFIYPLEHDRIVSALCRYSSFAAPAVMYRKDPVLKIGGYDPSFKVAEDYDLWVRMAEASLKFANLSSILIDYRVHQKSISRSNQSALEEGTRRCMERAARFLGSRKG